MGRRNRVASSRHAENPPTPRPTPTEQATSQRARSASSEVGNWDSASHAPLPIAALPTTSSPANNASHNGSVPRSSQVNAAPPSRAGTRIGSVASASLDVVGSELSAQIPTMVATSTAPNTRVEATNAGRVRHTSATTTRSATAPATTSHPPSNGGGTHSIVPEIRATRPSTSTGIDHDCTTWVRSGAARTAAGSSSIQ